VSDGRYGVHHPLEIGDVGVEIFADRQQADVDHRAVDKLQPPRQDRRRQHQARPALPSRRAGQGDGAVAEGERSLQFPLSFAADVM